MWSLAADLGCASDRLPCIPGLTGSHDGSLVLFRLAASGIAPTFWPLPTAMLTGSAAAGGIALINSVGNLGGFLGPYAMGLVRDATGSFPLGLLAIAMGSVIGGLVV